MKVVVKIGERQDGKCVTSVELQDNGKYNTARCVKRAKEFRDLLVHATRFTAAKGFKVQFEFYIEPRFVQGPSEMSQIGIWTDFKRRGGCSSKVAAFGLEVMNVVLEHATPVEG